MRSSVPVIDHYWQTETGWAILAGMPGIEKTPSKFGSPSFPAYGYNVKLLHEATGEEVGVNEKGVVAIVPPLPPGCLSTVWGQDERFVKTYFTSFKEQADLHRPSTGAFATRTAITSFSAAPMT